MRIIVVWDVASCCLGNVRTFRRNLRLHLQHSCELMCWLCRAQGSLKCRYSYQTSRRHILEDSSILNQRPDILKCHSLTFRLLEDKIEVIKCFLKLIVLHCVGRYDVAYGIKNDGFYLKRISIKWMFLQIHGNCLDLATACSVINL
jgi:hypothetical protein